MKRTNRGFAVYTEFKCTYGSEVRVQKSSSACHRRCWVFLKEPINPADPRPDVHSPGEGSAHLSPAQARRVAKALLRFADGAE